MPAHQLFESEVEHGECHRDAAQIHHACLGFCEAAREDGFARIGKSVSNRTELNAPGGLPAPPSRTSELCKAPHGRVGLIPSAVDFSGEIRLILAGTGLAAWLTLEVDGMRSAQTIFCLATSACLTLTPGYAYSHGHPAAAPPHAQAPRPTKPTTTSKPSTTTAPSTATMSPIAQKISSHPQLASKVKSLLPPGTTLSHASAGFKNQGQFIAALHVSKNLGIPFSKLKADMTGDKPLSLGQSIQDLKPGARAATEAHHAEIEADDDVKTRTAPPAHKTIKKPESHTSTSAKLNPIAQKISSHPQLAAKVQALLPSGLTLNRASRGFKNQGQFLAALHASKDLNIPFAQLKAEMTGKDHDSLGMAIQELKPGANARTAASTAEHEADADVKATITQTIQAGDREDGQ
jgi:hypothetical protein